MPQTTVTTRETLSVIVYTEFTYDSDEVDFDPTQDSGWSLNEREHVEKVHRAFDGTEITEAEAALIFRVGDSEGAMTHRVQVRDGIREFDSLAPKAAIQGDDCSMQSRCGGACVSSPNSGV